MRFAMVIANLLSAMLQVSPQSAPFMSQGSKGLLQTDSHSALVSCGQCQHFFAWVSMPYSEEQEADDEKLGCSSSPCCQVD